MKKTKGKWKQAPHTRVRNNKPYSAGRGKVKRTCYKNYGAMAPSTISYLRDKGGEIFIVGGKVRDRLTGQESKDVDYLIRKIPPQRLVELLRKRGTAKIDNNMGVVKFKDALMPYQKEPDDIVLPRKEQSTGEGHRDFEMIYGENIPLKEDLQRRDFTINAMAMNAQTGEIVDPFGGKQDIKSKIIRLVNPNAFKEDPLRMMRAAQFAARMDANIASKTKSSMKQHSDLIKTVTSERISDEFRKGFGKGKNPEKMFDSLFDTGVLQQIIPETARIKNYEQNKYHKYNLDKHTHETIKAIGKLTQGMPQNKRFKLGMAALLHDLGKPDSLVITPGKGRQFLGHATKSADISRGILNKLKVSTDEKRDILSLVENHDRFLHGDISDKKIRGLIHKLGPGITRDLVMFRKADRLGQGKLSADQISKENNDFLKRVEYNIPITYGTKDLAITGKSLVNAYKIPPGKQIGEILGNMQKAVLSNPSLNNKVGLLQFIPKKYSK